MAWRVLATRARQCEPVISLTIKGDLCWTRVVDDAMGTPQRIDVLWDQGKCLLGIRPSANGDGLTVRRREGEHGYQSKVGVLSVLRAGGVLEHLELPQLSIPAIKNPDGIWSISLRGESNPRQRRRHGDKASDPRD